MGSLLCWSWFMDVPVTPNAVAGAADHPRRVQTPEQALRRYSCHIPMAQGTGLMCSHVSMCIPFTPMNVFRNPRAHGLHHSMTQDTSCAWHGCRGILASLTAVSFLLGALCSGTAGFAGM